MMKLEDFCSALDTTLDRVMTIKPDVAIAADETFSEYGLDSLDQMNMLLEIEDEIDMKIGDINLDTIDTPAKLYEHINNQSVI